MIPRKRICKIFLVIILFSAIFLFATPPDTTYITGGTISTDSTWSKARSPYVISGDVVVDNGATLTIEPGVEVLFEPVDLTSSGMNIQRTELRFVSGSRLNAIGTVSDSIIFRGIGNDPDENYWAGLLFGPYGSSDPSAKIKFCSINDVGSGGGDHYYGVWIFDVDSAIVEHNTFKNCTNGIGFSDYSTPNPDKYIIIQYNIFISNDKCIRYSGDFGNLDIRYCEMKSSECAVFCDNPGPVNGLYLEYNNFLENSINFQMGGTATYDANARYNYWGPTATAEMSAGPELRNISTIYDHFDDNSLGTVDYSQFLDAPWPEGEPVEFWEIVKTFPVQNSCTAPVDTTIEVKFNTVLNMFTVNENTVYVSGKFHGKYTCSYNWRAADSTLLIRPGNNMFYGEEISILLTDGIKSVSGGVGTAYRFSYNTRTVAKEWGIYSRPSWVSSANKIYSDVKYAEIDNDDLLDLVCLTSTNDTYQQALEVYINQGGYYLEEPTYSILTTLPSSFVGDRRNFQMNVVDVDADGDADISVHYHGDLRIFKNNNGYLSSSPSQVIEVSGYTSGFVWGNYNGDVYPDLAINEYFESYKVFVNNAGVISTNPVWTGTPQNTQGRGVTWVDFDNDGDDDVIFANELYINNSGSIGSKVFQFSDYSMNTMMVISGNIDDDPYPEIVFSSGFGNGSRHTIWDYSGGSNFTLIWSNDIAASKDIALVDADGDGDLDLYMGTSIITPSVKMPSPNYIFFNTGGQINDIPGWASDAVTYTNHSDWGDYDNDGDLDLITADGYDEVKDNLKIYTNHLEWRFNVLINEMSMPEYSRTFIVPYTIDNPGSNPTSLICRYSADNGTSWKVPTTSSDTTDISSTAYSGSIDWQSAVDLPGQDIADVIFAITPYDNANTGKSDTVHIHVDNNLPPTTEIVDITGEQSGSVPVTVNYADAENDTVDLVVDFAESGSSSWKDASVDAATIDLTGSSLAFNWTTIADLPDQAGTYWLRVSPSDNDAGTSDTISIRVDNYHQQSIVLSIDEDPARDTLAVNYVITDPTEDTLKLICRYSIDAKVSSGTWHIPYILEDTLQVASDRYVSALTWLTHYNLPGVDIDTVVLTIKPDDHWAIGTGDTLTFQLDNNRSPVVTLTPIPGEVADSVTIQYHLTDAENDSAAVCCEFKRKYELNWHPVTILGDTTGLSSGNHSIIWLSMTDIPDYTGQIQFRARPKDNDWGDFSEIEFLLDQLGAPVVNQLTIGTAAEYSGDVEVAYVVSDDEHDAINLSVEFSLDNGNNWHNATVSGSVSNITADHYSGSFIWKSATDATGIDSPLVCIWVTPNDGNPGGSLISEPFHLDNNMPPRIAVSLEYQEVSDNVLIPAVITDPENDPIRLELFYSLNNLITKTPANLASADTVSSIHYNDNLIWDSYADLPGVDSSLVTLLVKCFDNDAGNADSFSVHLDNNRVPQVVLTALSAEQHDTVNINFSSSDEEQDPLRFEAYWSLDNGANWHPATAAIINNRISWYSRQDISRQDQPNLKFRLRVFDNDEGIADEITFHLDNDQGRIVLTALTDEQHDDVRIPYSIVESGNDTLTISVFYQLPNKTVWNPATISSSTTIRPTMYDSALIWQSKTDLDHQYVENALFKVIPADRWGAGIADTITLNIDNESGPIVSTWSPDIASSQMALWSDLIAIQFDQAVDTNTLAGNITVNGTKSGSLLFDIAIQNTQEIKLLPETYYTALETITVELQSGIKNPWGTQLDGNKNGDPDPDPEDYFKFQFRTGMLADYDANNRIELADFNTLHDAWTGNPKDFSLELGPVSGEIPYLRINPDHQFDLSDLMVLVSMWNWSFDHSPDVFADLSLTKPILNDNSPVSLVSNYERNGVWNATLLDGLILELQVQRNQKIKAMEFYLKYDPKVVEFKEAKTLALSEAERDKWIMLSRDNPETGVAAITLYPLLDSRRNVSDFRRVGSVSFNALLDCKAEVQYQVTTITTEDDSLVYNKSTSSYEFETKPAIPRQFALHQNFPNPFNPITKIRYELPKACDVKLAVFDIRGALVKWIVVKNQQPGYYEVNWDGRNNAGQMVASGIYLYRIQAATYVKTQKMVLLK